jgi:hypothetical protein
MAASTPVREEQEPTDQAKAQQIQSNIVHTDLHNMVCASEKQDEGRWGI